MYNAPLIDQRGRYIRVVLEAYTLFTISKTREQMQGGIIQAKYGT